MSEGMKGLYNKYIIAKESGNPLAPGFEAIVLRIDGGKYVHACRKGVAAFAGAVIEENPILAADIQERLKHLTGIAVCVRCGRTEQIEEHHIVELSHGGIDKPSNKELRCQPCHKLEHAMRLIRASLHFEGKRLYHYRGIGDAYGSQKERIKVYERRLKALARLNTPSLIRKRGAYLSYWGDTSLHRLPRRIRSTTEEAVDNRISLALEKAQNPVFRI